MENLLLSGSRKDPNIASLIIEVLFDITKVCNTAPHTDKSDNDTLERACQTYY